MIEKVLEKLKAEAEKWFEIWDKSNNEDEYADGKNEGFIEAIEIVQEVAKDGGWFHLPCKVGDTVYRLTASKNAYYKTKVSRITIYKDSIWVHFFNGKGVSIKEIGKSVFLTETGAEEALAKRGE